MLLTGSIVRRWTPLAASYQSNVAFVYIALWLGNDVVLKTIGSALVLSNLILYTGIVHVYAVYQRIVAYVAGYQRSFSCFRFTWKQTTLACYRQKRMASGAHYRPEYADTQRQTKGCSDELKLVELPTENVEATTRAHGAPKQVQAIGKYLTGRLQHCCTGQDAADAQYGYLVRDDPFRINGNDRIIGYEELFSIFFCRFVRGSTRVEETPGDGYHLLTRGSHCCHFSQLSAVRVCYAAHRVVLSKRYRERFAILTVYPPGPERRTPSRLRMALHYPDWRRLFCTGYISLNSMQSNMDEPRDFARRRLKEL